MGYENTKLLNEIEKMENENRLEDIILLTMFGETHWNNSNELPKYFSQSLAKTISKNIEHNFKLSNALKDFKGTDLE